MCFGSRVLGRIWALNYPGCIAGSTRARLAASLSWVVRRALFGTRAAWSQRWSSGLEVWRSGGLPQLQRNRPPEITGTGGTDGPLSCGEGIPYTHSCGIHEEYVLTVVSKCHFPCVCVCVCVCTISLCGLKRGWHGSRHVNHLVKKSNCNRAAWLWAATYDYEVEQEVEESYCCSVLCSFNGWRASV